MIVYWAAIPSKRHVKIFDVYSAPIVVDDYEEIAKIIKATKGLLSSRDVGLDVFMVKGDSVLEKNIYAVMFGDYVSLYLAALREVNPCNVDPIVDIKARIRSVLPE